MLGDNPFFGVSHQGPKKSIGYLASNRFANARDVVITASSVGIDLFMVSSTPILKIFCLYADMERTSRVYQIYAY